MSDGGAKREVKKVVLAYSGGLDTSIILKWLQTTYGCEVVTFTADLGQGEELAPARDKALLLGVKPQNIFIEDLREEFVRDYVFPMFRANALYEGQYLLGTSCLCAGVCRACSNCFIGRGEQFHDARFRKLARFVCKRAGS